jgi:hypothetical protein
VAVAVGFVARGSVSSGGEQLLDGGEGLIIDDLRVHDVL